VIGAAQTGTGKTAAFLIPTVERLLAARRTGDHASALVLAPTRELAHQIHGWAERLGCGMRVAWPFASARAVRPTRCTLGTNGRAGTSLPSEAVCPREPRAAQDRRPRRWTRTRNSDRRSTRAMPR
jgi:hypothetical protein